MPTKDRKDKFARHKALIEKRKVRADIHIYNNDEICSNGECSSYDYIFDSNHTFIINIYNWDIEESQGATPSMVISGEWSLPIISNNPIINGTPLFIEYNLNEELVEIDEIGEKIAESVVNYFSIKKSIESINNVDLGLLIIDSQDGFDRQAKRIFSLLIKKSSLMFLIFNKIDLIKQKKKILFRH